MRLRKERTIFKYNYDIYMKFKELKAFHSAKLIVENMLMYTREVHADKEMFVWIGLQYEINQLIAKSKSHFSFEK